MFPLQVNDSAIAQNNIPVADRSGDSVEALTPDNFDTSVLAGFRKEYRCDAAKTAQKTLAAGAEATENLLQMAGWIQETKSRLRRKEFNAFVKQLLQWVGEEARKYLDIAKAFDGFDLSRLVSLEPFTLLKLRSKRYAPIVEKLRDVPVITSKIVHDLIGEVLPKQSRKKPIEPISGWKHSRSGGGRYYNVLLHNEEVGLLIEKQAQAEGILPQKVIAEAVALRAKYKESNLEAQGTELVANPLSLTDGVQQYTQPRLLEVEEVAPTQSAFVHNQQPIDDAMPQGGLLEGLALMDAKDPIDEVTIAQREGEQYLQEQATEIAVLPEGSVLAGEDETEIQWLLNTSLDSVEQVIGSVPVRSAYRALYLLNQFQSGDTKRMELLEDRVTEHHIAVGAVEPRQVTPKEKTWNDETETQSKDSEQDTLSSEAEPVSECLKPAQEDFQKLEPEQKNLFNEGDLVEINVNRSNGDKTWNGLRGYIQQEATATDTAVVLLQGDYRSKQFFKDELKLVSPVITENLEATAVTKGAADFVPAQEVEAEAEPQVFQEGSSVEIVSSRHGEDLVWQAGIVTFANDVGCVVNVANKTVWFCVDELILVPATPQAAPE